MGSTLVDDNVVISQQCNGEGLCVIGAHVPNL